MCKCTIVIERELDAGDYRWDAEKYENSEPQDTIREVVQAPSTDIDTHRYKCDVCGEIGYYSGAAKEHFTGKKKHSWITETNKKH